MSRRRTGLAAGVVVALVVAVWAAVSSGSESSPTTTSTSFVPTTATTTIPPTTAAPATNPPTTITSTPDSTTDHEARTEEVRLILEDLYFRWFDAIYHNDEEAVREVVATEQYLEAFRQAVETLGLPSPPQRRDVRVDEFEVLLEDRDCVVTFSVLDLRSWRGSDAITSGVNVLYMVDGQWRLGTSWVNRSDLWETDCPADLSPLP